MIFFSTKYIHSYKKYIYEAFLFYQISFSLIDIMAHKTYVSIHFYCKRLRHHGTGQEVRKSHRATPALSNDQVLKKGTNKRLMNSGPNGILILED